MIAIALFMIAQASGDSAPQPPRRVPMDSVAAVVDRRVITVSEVEAESRLTLLDRNMGLDVARAGIDMGLMRAVLDTMIAHELLALEARRTGLTVREVDVDRAVTDTRKRIADAEQARLFFARAGIDEELLRARARRDLAASALIGKALADAMKVTDDEARAYQTLHPDLDLDGARAALIEDRRSTRVKQLLDRLRSTVEVRVVWSP